MKEILLASPRGFCAGVDRAIGIVERALELYGTPLYVNHEIVHNKHVVSQLEKKGVIFVESLHDVPQTNRVIFSAHGVSPKLHKIAIERSLEVIDATCPLVTKVHLEAKRYARDGYQIILIGHKNHVEARGTFGEAPDQITIVENLTDIDNLVFSEEIPLAYLTQTTLSVLDTKEIIAKLKEKFPQIEGPSSSDICYATTNRQSAVATIAPQSDLVLVIGSANSSNSNRLCELAESFDTRAYLIDSYLQINPIWLTDVRNVGVAAGASAPENLVEEVVVELQTKFGFSGVRNVHVKDENVVFKLPKKLREVCS